MKIVSTNIGEARTVLWHGNKITTGIYKYSVNNPIYLGNEDVDNDNVVDRKYHGGLDKACYLYSADHYNYWEKLYPRVKMPWGMFGENLTVAGMHEAEINIGDIFKIGDSIVQATQPRQPCFKLDIRFESNGVLKQFINSSFPGVYVRVLEKGEVKKGDLMELVERKIGISIQKVFQLIYAKEFEKDAVETAVNNPFIAESCKRDLQNKWKNEL
ncbi:MAG: MOSC domain-containing protein [Draconibacterium sp.]|nr:MOSC domain-containing protein [Draconibacterium sp.]